MRPLYKSNTLLGLLMTSTTVNIVLSNSRKCIDLSETFAVTGQTRFKLDRYEVRTPHDDSDEENAMSLEHPRFIKWMSSGNERPRIDLNFLVQSNRQSYPYTTPSGKTLVIDFSQVKKTEGKLFYALYENLGDSSYFLITDDFLLDPSIQVVITLVPHTKKWECVMV